MLLSVFVRLPPPNSKTGLPMKGFVPTPDRVVDLMVDKLFVGRPPTVSSRLLDPGCGRGAFIAGVLRWCAENNRPVPEIVGIESELQYHSVLLPRACGAPMNPPDDDRRDGLRDHARRYRLRLIGNAFEWSNSETVEDYTEKGAAV